MKPRLFFVAIAIFFVAIMQVTWRRGTAANIAFAEDPLAVAAVSKLIPGLTLSFENSDGEITDARAARLIALLVPATTPASPLMSPGPFTATWAGTVTTKIKDTYRFAAEGRGDLTVTLNDKPLLNLHGEFADHPSDALMLKKGRNRLLVSYHSPPDGDAGVRLLWAASGRPLEPVSPAVLSHDAGDDLMMKHSAVRVGRELIATMRCAACHQGINGSMPELKQDAPSLADLKNRLRPTWLMYWITNPKALRPTATMPRIFHDTVAKADPTVDPRAADIAAYLSPDDAPPVEKPADPAELARGARLFTGLGCVACHVAPGVDDSDPALNRVTLKFVRDKFRAGALAAFLKAPEGHYAWIRMPNFHLSDTEASSISAWLLANCRDDSLPGSKNTFDAMNGRKLFETCGCLSCHATDNSQPTEPHVTEFIPERTTGGCLADDPVRGKRGVDFDFTAEQRQAIRAFLAADWKPALARDPLTEFSTRQMISLRCSACHSMDGRESDWSNLDSEITTIEQNLPARPDDDPEPKGDQSRPPLTWTGEKLQPGWMTAFLSGNISVKPRPWLFARMPAFASRAARLSEGLALSHGCSSFDEARPPVDENLADIGRQLTSQTGLGCVKCHAVGDQAALAPFEAEAPNFSQVQARLRHDYFTRWMRNPQYYLPGTKMPSFADANGQTPLKDVLNGNAAAEFEAIWNYLRPGEKIVPVQ